MLKQTPNLQTLLISARDFSLADAVERAGIKQLPNLKRLKLESLNTALVLFPVPKMFPSLVDVEVNNLKTLAPTSPYECMNTLIDFWKELITADIELKSISARIMVNQSLIEYLLFAKKTLRKIHLRPIPASSIYGPIFTPFWADALPQLQEILEDLRVERYSTCSIYCAWYAALWDNTYYPWPWIGVSLEGIPEPEYRFPHLKSLSLHVEVGRLDWFKKLMTKVRDTPRLDILDVSPSLYLPTDQHRGGNADLEILIELLEGGVDKWIGPSDGVKWNGSRYIRFENEICNESLMIKQRMYYQVYEYIEHPVLPGRWRKREEPL